MRQDLLSATSIPELSPRLDGRRRYLEEPAKSIEGTLLVRDEHCPAAASTLTDSETDFSLRYRPRRCRPPVGSVRQRDLGSTSADPHRPGASPLARRAGDVKPLPPLRAFWEIWQRFFIRERANRGPTSPCDQLSSAAYSGLKLSIPPFSRGFSHVVGRIRFLWRVDPNVSVSTVQTVRLP